MTTVVKCRHELDSAEGIFIDAPCVVDKNLLSGRTYLDSGSFVGPWIELLETSRKA